MDPDPVSADVSNLGGSNNSGSYGCSDAPKSPKVDSPVVLGATTEELKDNDIPSNEKVSDQAPKIDPDLVAPNYEDDDKISGDTLVLDEDSGDEAGDEASSDTLVIVYDSEDDSAKSPDP